MTVVLDLARGNRAASFAERGDDLYETPPCAVRALLSVEPVPLTVWEPACGPGAIVSILRDSGRAVIATDLVDWGCPDSEPRRDFLLGRKAPAGVPAIVTNPPFKLAEEFAAHAVDLVPEVYLLMRCAFLEGLRWYAPEENARGRGLSLHLSRVWVFAPRLPFMHRHGFEGQKQENSGMAFAWFVFQRNAARFQAAQIRWLNPRKFMEAA